MRESVAFLTSSGPAAALPDGSGLPPVNQKAPVIPGGGLRLSADRATRARPWTPVNGTAAPGPRSSPPGTGAAVRVHVPGGDWFPVGVHMPNHPAVTDRGAQSLVGVLRTVSCLPAVLDNLC